MNTAFVLWRIVAPFLPWMAYCIAGFGLWLFWSFLSHRWAEQRRRRVIRQGIIRDFYRSSK